MTTETYATPASAEVRMLVEALRSIRENMPASEREMLDAELKRGHQHLLDVIAGRPTTGSAPEAVIAYSLLFDDPDQILERWDRFEAIVDGSGIVYFGGVQYDQTDLFWLYVFLAWDETRHHKPVFNNRPRVIDIPDTVSLDLLGDWGGNNQAARDVAGQVNSGHVVVHLGDVYYAGTNRTNLIEWDFQKTHFLDVWPGREGRSFALNSNHDMYAHGKGYFDTALTSPVFSAQHGCSYFALKNKDFRIVGLDTAFYDTDRYALGFMKGDLGPDGPGTQAHFLECQANEAAEEDQMLIILSHHNGLDVAGSRTEKLWDQVVGKIGAMTGRKVIWYWGHEHIGAVYTSRTVNGIEILPRCCGHSCIPWGIAKNLQNDDVTWYESKLRGPGPNYFVVNGLARLSLSPGTVSEAFLDEDGLQSWP